MSAKSAVDSGEPGKLGNDTSSLLIDGADHSFHVPARSGRTDAGVLSEVATALAGWVDSLV